VIERWLAEQPASAPEQAAEQIASCGDVSRRLHLQRVQPKDQRSKRRGYGAQTPEARNEEGNQQPSAGKQQVVQVHGARV